MFGSDQLGNILINYIQIKRSFNRPLIFTSLNKQRTYI